MPKYQIDVQLLSTFIFDTDKDEGFAKTKDELVDKLDPNDPDVIHDFVREEICETGDLDDFDPPSVARVLVSLVK